MKETLIGWLVIEEPTDYTRHYETAAWYTTIRVQPGRYPITMRGPVTGACTLHSSLPGVVVSQNTASLYGGVPIASGRPSDPDKGKPDTYGWYVHGARHGLARRLESGNWSTPGGRIELLPGLFGYRTFFGWSCRIEQKTHYYRDGSKNGYGGPRTHYSRGPRGYAFTVPSLTPLKLLGTGAA